MRNNIDDTSVLLSKISTNISIITYMLAFIIGLLIPIAYKLS